MSTYQDLLKKALEAHNQIRQKLRSLQTMAKIDGAVDGFAKPFDKIAAAIDAKGKDRFSGDFDNTILNISKLLLAQMEVLRATLAQTQANDRAAVMSIVVQRGPSIELAKKLREADEVLFARAAEMILMANDDATKAAGDGTEFQQLVMAWKRDTAFESASERMAEHSAYRKIVAMGKDAVPLLLAEMRERPDYWFMALNEITKADPVPPEAKGDLARMTQAWLDWGKANGYLQEPG